MASPERSLSDLRAWLASAPTGTLVPAALVHQLMSAEPVAQTPTSSNSLGSWRERFWTVPPEMRIGVTELCEATGRPKSWVYRNTGPSAVGPRLPHRLMHGELVFVVGEVRQWLLEQESVVVPGRTGPIVLQPKQSRRA